MIMVSMPPVLLLESTLGAITHVPDDRPLPLERDRRTQRESDTLKITGKTDNVQRISKKTQIPLTSSGIINIEVCIQVLLIILNCPTEVHVIGHWQSAGLMSPANEERALSIKKGTAKLSIVWYVSVHTTVPIT